MQSNNLNIYAKAEHLFDLDEPTRILNRLFIERLQRYGIKTVLDIGCGRGSLIRVLKESGLECKGVDLSSVMVESAKRDGLDVELGTVDDIDGKFDAIVAVFDVLNFIEPEDLGNFLDSVAARLNDGGVFIADINTEYGFAGVADGLICAEDENMFVSMESEFDGVALKTSFVLFSKMSDECYKRESSCVTQYYYSLRLLKGFDSLKLIEHEKISLYDKNDKMLVVFKKM